MSAIPQICNFCKKNNKEATKITCATCKMKKCNVCLNVSLSTIKVMKSNKWHCSPQCTQMCEELSNEIESPTLLDIYKMIKDVQHSQKFISLQFEDFRTELKGISEKVNSIEQKTDAHEEDITVLNKRVSYLESTLENYESESIKNNIIITNAPSNDAISAADTYALICDKIEFPSTNTTKEIKYITSKTANKTQTVLVKFNDVKTKDEFLIKKKAYGALFEVDLGLDKREGVRKQLYFRDELTRNQMKLYEKAREWKSEYEYKYIWIQKGRIMLRKDDDAPYNRISTEDDLRKLSSRKNNKKVKK